MYMNSLPKAAPESAAAGSQTHDLLISSPVPYHYATEPHNAHVLKWKFSGASEQFWPDALRDSYLRLPAGVELRFTEWRCSTLTTGTQLLLSRVVIALC